MKKPCPKIAILILNFNGYEDTLECLESIQMLSYPNFQTILIDNASQNRSVEILRSRYPEIPLLESEENLGFAGGNNLGIQWALDHGADWILLLNNDTVVANDFLEHLITGTQEKPNGGIFGAKILQYHKKDRIDHLGGYWSPRQAEFICPNSGEKDHPFFEMKEADYVCGAAMLIKKEVIESVGVLEPRFFLFWEETDYCYRAKRAGFEVWTVPRAEIWHKGSASFSGGKPHMHYFWWRSRLLWIQRNCTAKEKRTLYRKIIAPQLWKMVRHLILKTMSNRFSPSEARQKQIRRYRAGCRGVFDYFRGKFGNCPKWLVR